MNGDPPSDTAVRIHVPDDADRLAADLFGRPLTAEEWAQAVGVPAGATSPCHAIAS